VQEHTYRQPVGRSTNDARIDVLLVCSPGGHALQLKLLSGAWSEYDTVLVTLEAEDTRTLFEGERVIYAHGPTNRSVANLLRNLVLAWHVVRSHKPRAIVTTGAGVAVPFAWVGRLFGAKVVYIESLTRIERPSLSYRLIAPVTNRMYAQWPELAERVDKARYAGTVMGSP
jgi:beta-1,4-N-acetylglucosaminyltransferase